MTLAVVIVILWESLAAALAPGLPLPDPALAFAVAIASGRRGDDAVAAPLVLGGLSGLFTAAPWALRPLECLAAAAVASWLMRSIGPSGLLGHVIVVLVSVLASVVVVIAASLMGPGGADAGGLLVSAVLSTPLVFVVRAFAVAGRGRSRS